MNLVHAEDAREGELRERSSLFYDDIQNTRQAACQPDTEVKDSKEGTNSKLAIRPWLFVNQKAILKRNPFFSPFEFLCWVLAVAVLR